jgi:hypothetical protein
MVVRPNKQEIVFDASIDHGIEEIREHMADPSFLRLAANARIAMTDKYATLVHPNSGLYWHFSLEKASLVRSGSIFKTVRPDVFAKQGYVDAILCVNPEKDGTVLISAVEEAAVMTEIGNTFEDLMELRKENPELSGTEAMKLWEDRRKELAKRNPLLVWYRIHPESGRLEKLGVPPIDGAYVRDGDKNDEWRPMPDGSVKMGPIAINRAAPAKATKTDQGEAKEEKGEAEDDIENDAKDADKGEEHEEGAQTSEQAEPAPEPA